MVGSMDDKKRVACPVCGKYWPKSSINVHVNGCLNEQKEEDPYAEGESDGCQGLSPPSKQVRRETVGLHDSQCSFSPKLKTGSSVTVSVAGRSSREVVLANISSSTNSDTGDVGQSRKASAWGCLARLKPTKSSPPKGSNVIGQQKTSCSILTSSSTSSLPSSSSTATAAAQEGNNDMQLDNGPLSLSNSSSKPKPNMTSASKSVGSNIIQSHIPLAERMRPKSMSEYIGQEHVVGRDKLLRTLLESQQIPSMILWGPPGCGKTTLAKVIAQKSKDTPGQSQRFVQLSATTSGIADVKEVVKIAKNELKMFKRKTILFVDEIHRFNKLQQDTFLPHIEDGTITLIGATTENPSFQVNNALLSRSRVIPLEKLTVEHVEQIVERAVHAVELTLVEDNDVEDKSTSSHTSSSGRDALHITREALHMLAVLCDGDARIALNSLQSAVDCKRAALALKLHGGGAGPTDRLVGITDIKEGLQRSHVNYDRAGEEHYNCASALQKSIRGSDDSGAIYWLARMLEGGEDPLFIARRLVVCASEDIGLADSQAVVLAVATFQACHFLGMPECAINLAHCVTYMARAPKSNESYSALARAKKSIKEHEGPLPGVPLHLRNAPTKLMKDLGYGVGYKYAHSYKGPVDQDYLPQELLGVNFFKDTD